MSIFKNPEYNTLISVLIIGIFVGVGYLVITNAGTPDNSQTGKIIEGTRYNLNNNMSGDRQFCSYIVTGGAAGSSCVIQYQNCSTSTGTVQACAGSSIAQCCCTDVSNPDSCEPSNQAVGKDTTLLDDAGATNVSGGATTETSGDTTGQLGS